MKIKRAIYLVLSLLFFLSIGIHQASATNADVSGQWSLTAVTPPGYGLSIA